MHHKSIIKLFIASLGIIIILFLGGMIYINNNLSTYFIYYAKHLPHAKNTNPEMVMILDNLDSIDDPNIKGLRYDTDGNNSIINGEGTILTQAPDSNSIQYALIPKGTPQENYRTYYFSDMVNFILTIIKDLTRERIFTMIVKKDRGKPNTILMK